VTTPPLVDRGKPAVVHIPKYKHTRGSDIHAVLDEFGLEHMPWHALALRHALAYGRGEQWIAQQVAILVPWREEKDHLVLLRELYGAALLGERVMHLSQALNGADELFQKMVKVIDTSATLDGLVRIIRRSLGEQKIEFHGGGSIRFRARQQIGGGNRGFAADLLVVDDALRTSYETLLPVLAPSLVTAKDGPQIWWVDARDEREQPPPAGPYPELLKQASTPKSAQVLYLEWTATR
jgi:hypothetical protein